MLKYSYNSTGGVSNFQTDVRYLCTKFWEDTGLSFVRKSFVWISDTLLHFEKRETQMRRRNGANIKAKLISYFLTPSPGKIIGGIGNRNISRSA